MAVNPRRIADPKLADLAREPAVVEFIERFPLPIAVVDRRGEAVLFNEPFSQKYSEDILHALSVQEALHQTGQGWKTLEIPQGDQETLAIRALSADLPAGSMLILDDAIDEVVLRQLEHLQAQVAALRLLCSVDVPTGAWNRNHFERTVGAEIHRSVRFRQPLSLVFIDIDHFKHVNDAYGHQVGDSVLRELVAVIRQNIYPTDMLFRWGGEEFAVIAASTGHRGSAALAEKIRAAVENHRFEIAGSVTVSIGAAEHLAPETAQAWLRRADIALYRAKEAGRNRVWVEPEGASDAWSGPSVVRLVWQEAYECGEPNIDAQHRELFALTNAALDASFETSSARPQYEAAIDKLFAHIVSHFGYEEAALEALHYGDLARHKAAHAGLLAQAKKLRAAVAANRSTIGELVEFIANDVVAQHLFGADKMYFLLFSEPLQPSAAPAAA